MWLALFLGLLHSVVNVGENHGYSSSSLMHDLGPKNPGTFANGDPFLVKLQEIDWDLRKFDNSLSDKSRNSKLSGVAHIRWIKLI